jgi:hypothetical protein
MAVAAVGVAAWTVPGFVVAGVALLAGIALAVRIHDRSLTDVLRHRLRDPAGEQVPAAPDPGAPDLGAAPRLLPDLHLAETVPRRASPIGIVGDGQGFVLVLEADTTSSGPVQLADLVELVLTDASRPAAVQLLIEQRGRARTSTTARFGPAETYRTLPTAGIPLWNRVLLVVRHEPTWAPLTVETRGGGATGARAALTATAARLVAAAARSGRILRPLDARAIAAVFRDVGDPGPDCETRPASWITSTACHTTVSVSPGFADEPDALATLLRATPELDVDRCVLSVAVSAVDHTACAVLRLVAPDLAQVEAAAADLVERGLAVALSGEQEAGVVASLPLGGGARSFADLVDQGRS